MLPEPLILNTRCPPHPLDHLFVEFHGGRKDLWVSAEDVAKVDVDQVTRLREEEVVKVTVTNTKEVCDNRVASCMW